MKDKRLARVVRNMEELNLKQILVTQTESIYYLTGLWVQPGERMLALKVDIDGCCTLYVNRMFALEGLCPGLRLKEFDDVDDPTGLLAAGLRTGRLGIDKFWPSRFTIELMQKRPDLEMVLGSEPVDRARMLKDQEELEAMRRSSRMNDQVVGALPQTLALGDTEAQVGRRYAQQAVDLGARGASFTPLVCFGKGCAEPHHSSDNTPLREGDAVILDLGLDLEHMMSDMTRTVFFGSVTPEQRKVYEVVKAANEAGRAAVRPGIPMSQIDRAARKVIEDAGYGPYFLHRTGHGIGLSVHEPPDCSAACHLIAQPGMVFSIEPGIYLAGKFGVRIEDLVAVTEDGGETLNALDRELHVIET